MEYNFSPSIMCSKPWDMLTYIRQFEKSGIKMIHYDVMDGNFVPNIMLGTETFKAIHKETKLAIDVHLMCKNPDVAIDYFDIRKGDRVCFHPQTISASYTLLLKIKKMGAVPGIALNPGSPINQILEFKSLLDYVLVMSVEPGFAGQKMLPDAIDKIKRVAKLKEENKMKFDIMVDGNCNSTNVKKMVAAGANSFVIGSALFNSKIKPSEFSKKFKSYKKEIFD